MPSGRPTDYTPELAAEICARIADGRSVREIARSDDMPAMSSIFLWLSKYQEFSEQYAQACDARVFYMAEELLDIADDGTNDWMERKGSDGESVGYTVNGEAIQRSKLRADTRKWLMSKMQPKKYGEKMSVVHDGEITHRMSEAEIDKRLAELEEKSG